VVENVQAFAGFVLHIGKLEKGTLSVGEPVTAKVGLALDENRLQDNDAVRYRILKRVRSSWRNPPVVRFYRSSSEESGALGCRV
jgi:hypothetical protein